MDVLDKTANVILTIIYFFAHARTHTIQTVNKNQLFPTIQLSS